MLSRNFSSQFSTFNFSFSRDINSRVHDEMCDLKKTLVLIKRRRDYKRRQSRNNETLPNVFVRKRRGNT